jgi:PTH2 family peptidyl-tRNA hydrolase
MIILRKDLNMRKGKMVAQGAHASMKATLEYLDHPYVTEWLSGRFTKIAVGVPGLDELFEIYALALRDGLPCSLILDAGKTEFGGVPTYTAVAVGPAPNDVLFHLTGDLKLL